MTSENYQELDHLFTAALNAPGNEQIERLRGLAEALSKCDALTIDSYANKVANCQLASRRTFKNIVHDYQDNTGSSGRINRPTDDELADRWLEKHPNTLYGLGEFRRLEFGVYPACDLVIIEKEILEIIEEAKPEGIRPNGRIMASVLMIAKVKISIPNDQWDTNVDYLPCKNGLVHLPTSTLHDHNPELLFTSGLDYDYNPEADCPVFKQVLAHAVPGAESFLQEFAGYCLTIDTSLETAVWLYGPPGGGKSTIITGLMAMLGTRSGVLSKADIERNSFGLASLPGKTLMVSNEQPSNSALVTDTLNSIISGEPLNINRKFREAFEFNPTAKLLWSMNELPRVSSANNGLLRRVKIIQVPALPESEQDPTLKDKVKLEAAGILNWALEGLRRLKQRDRFDPPKQVLAATNEFKTMVDLPGQFVEECCEKGTDFSEQTSVMYEEYKSWCANSGHEVKSITAIAEDWKRLGFKRYQSNGRVRWKGVRVR